jgi:3-methyladenine DNA glycosylase/8-oxoguanine DNA glycosylase
MPYSCVLEELTFARRIADHASFLGVQCSPATFRCASDHMGAALADAVLQAGVSYRTVVRTRINRIRAEFPEAATLPGLVTVLERQGVEDFLLWSHPIKVSRFVSLIEFLATKNISTTVELKLWLVQDEARENLLSLQGIGPKTYDYLCCLVGIDCVAVDRHMRTFANEAGVPISDYDRLKSVVSCAADLLGMTRRDFDGWIWKTISARKTKDEPQLSLI